MSSKTLPIALDEIRVASPCDASWDAMQGDERVRFCGSCRKNVFNLSNMTREDAEALVRRTEQAGAAMCVRFYRRGDGTLLTQDCPVGLAAVRRRLAWIGAAVAAGLAVVAAFVGLRVERGGGAGQGIDRGGHVMGDYAPPAHAVMGRMKAPERTPPVTPHGERVTMGEMIAPVDSAD